MPAAPFKYRLIAGLLHELEREGYPMAPDKLLQVQELLRRLPADLPPERLRSLLAPLFAAEPRQQERFYELFSLCLAETRALFAEVEEAPTPETMQQAEARKGEARWRSLLLIFPPLLAALAGFAWEGGLGAWYGNPGLWLAIAVLAGTAWAAWKLLHSWPRRLGLLLLALAMGGAGFWLKTALEPEVVKPITSYISFQAIPGDTATQNLRRPADTARLLYAEPREVVETPLGGRFRVDSSGTGSYIASPEAEPGRVDSLTALLSYAWGTDTVYWAATVIEPPAPPAPPDTNLIAEIEPPYFRDIAELKFDAAAARRIGWYLRYEWPMKAALLLLLGGLTWAILRWDQYRRAKVVAELQRPNRPPYVWQPDTGQDAAALLAPGLQLLLARLRGRAPDSRLRLDVPATIRATSRQAGRISFVYRRLSLPPDYLLLIDRLAANDHRAHLFDSLYQVFLRAEAPVARYFYDGDPRVLFGEAHPHGIPLAELLHRHDGAQLIMIGEGQGLLSPATGRPAPWTSLLAAWPRRVLLSPRPLRAWGPRERQLEELLPLLPASLGGLGAALALFASEDPSDTRSLLPKVEDALQQPFAFRHDLLEDLQRHFPQPVIDRIAACAIWPALHWSLSLHLGRSLSEIHGKELITFENLRDLARLPWFTEGRIPEAARSILLDYLGGRGLEEPLRQSLRQLLRQAPAPPADSAAYDGYRMNLILNELFLKPDAAARRRLEREFAAYLAAGKKPDLVALRLLGRPPTRLDVLLGSALKKYAFREGLPGLGWRLGPKLIGIWAVLATALLAFPLNLDLCKRGEPVSYQGMELCLSSSSDSLLYLEYLAADAILAQDTQGVDSLRAAADAIQLRDTAFYRNTAARYYNYAARAWNCTLQPGPDCDALPTDSLQAIACANFRRGGTLSETLAGRMGIQYSNAMQRVCLVGEPPPAFFSLSGSVVDAGDGSPIADAIVRVGDANRVTAGRLAAGPGPNIFSAATDARGRFAFDSLPAMEQLLLYAAAPGHEPYELRSPPRDELPPIRLSPTDEALEAAAWARALAANSPEGFSNYLAAFPGGARAAEARQRLDDFASAREQAAWQEAQRVNTTAAYEAFLRDYPSGAYATDARRRLAQLQDEAAWRQAQAAGTAEACLKYLEDWPQGQHVEEARRCAAVLPAPVQKLINDMVRVPGGTFTMGCQEGRDTDCYDDEKPPHDVSVPDFSIGRYEVTQEQWRAVMGSDPPQLYNKGCGQCPVERVSWNDIREFIQKLNALAGQRFRLPTEAEWEYAARGGRQSRGYLYSGGNNIDEVAWYSENSRSGNTHGEQQTTRPAGGKRANELGLYDMSGNVWEWVEDVWHENYQGAPKDGSAWLAGGDSGRRVLRGGAWSGIAWVTRLSDRVRVTVAIRIVNSGFRLARD